MSAQTVSCPACGKSLVLIPGQSLAICASCRGRFAVRDPGDPVLFIRPAVTLSEARQIVVGSLQSSGFERGFASRTSFERGALYFLPYYETNGARAGLIKMEKLPSSLDDEERRAWESLRKQWRRLSLNPGISSTAESPSYTFVCNSFQTLSPANDQRSLEIGEIDSVQIQQSLSAGEYLAASTENTRRLGVVLPLNRPEPDFAAKEKSGLQLVEHRTRIIYFPVFEFTHSDRGLLYKSYVDAVRGIPLKIQGLHEAGKNLLHSLSGISILAVCIALAIKAKWLPLLPVAFFLFVALFPYLWELFQFREILERRPDGESTAPIGYYENFLIAKIKKIFADWGRKE